MVSDPPTRAGEPAGAEPHSLKAASAGGCAQTVFLLKGYPRLSETFIAQEIRALEQRGLAIRIV